MRNADVGAIFNQKPAARAITKNAARAFEILFAWARRHEQSKTDRQGDIAASEETKNYFDPQINLGEAEDH